MKKSPLVLICTCHETLTRSLPKSAVKSGITARRPLADIEFVPSMCRPEDMKRIAELLESGKPSGVVAGACSPLARGNGVIDCLARLDPELPVALVDLREGCAWIHGGNPDDASAKAVDLVCMELAAIERRERSPRYHFLPERRVLVAGAGPAGLAAAGTLARLGVEVTLADRMSRPGGLLNQIGRLFPDNIPATEFLAPLLRDAQHPAVNFLPKTTVTRIDGDPGAFEVVLTRDGRDETIRAGAVIMACGAMPAVAEGRFRSGELSGVISQLELENRLRKIEEEKAALPDVNGVVFIQCVGSREEAHPYCSTICCPTALKNALRLGKICKTMRITVLHRGIMTPGRALEELYRQAGASGVRFAAYSPEGPPEVRGNGSVSSVCLTDALSGRRMEIPAGIVVLSTPLRPRPEATGLANSLGLRLDPVGFVCGQEPMQPISLPLPGVYLCGAVRWPVSAGDAVDQGRAAAVKTAAFLAQDGESASILRAGAGIASIRTEACSRCGRCIAGCPYGACRLEKSGPVTVSGVRCRGCGLCAAVCPSGAARVPKQSGGSVRAMIREMAPGVRWT